MEAFYAALADGFQTVAIGAASTAIVVGAGVGILVALVVGPSIFGGRGGR